MSRQGPSKTGLLPQFEHLEPRVLLDSAPVTVPLSGGAFSDAATGCVVAYVTIPSQKENGQFAGGVYRTTDRGETWQWAMGAGINKTIGQHPWGESDIDQYWFLDQAETNPNIIYVTNRGTGYAPPYHYTVYRSDNAGDTWDDRFFNDPRYAANNTEVGWLFWARSRDWGDCALGFGVNSADPNQAFYTNYGEIFLTTDDATTWHQAYSQYDAGQPPPSQTDPGRWTSIGLEDTTCWRYVFDPHVPNRTYICYTDIGLARSEDRGLTWYSSDRTIPWHNTIYQLACDPDVPGRIYAACSNQHDIPHWRSIQGPTLDGGICMSTDGGVTWTTVTNGFPAQPTPCTTVVMDPTSPVNSRTLYAGVYGHGVYKSTDGGQHWVQKSSGIVPELNRQVYEIKLCGNGWLYCSVAGRRAGNGVATDLTGGLYRSTDGAETWKRISSDDIFRPVDFAVHPDDPNTLYVAAMDGLGHSGGVYKTTDGGLHWTRHVPDYDRNVCSYIEGFSVALNPQNPDIAYFMTITHGIFVSHDAGETWQTTTPTSSPPFLSCQRMDWDPQDPGTVYVVTLGGGVWKGPDPAFPSADPQRSWESLGLGGGGAMYYPAASPHDPEILFVSSDMGGLYRSDDGGRSWTMLDWRNTQHLGLLVFHPTNPNVVYACPWQGSGDNFMMSADAGVTWQRLGGASAPWTGDNLTSFAVDQGNPGLMLLAGSQALYRSTDGALTWTKVPGAPGGLLGMHVDQTSPVGSRVVLAANSYAPYRSDDGGLTWAEKSSGLPWRNIRSFSAGSDPFPVVIAVRVNGGAAYRSRISTLAFQFSEDVSASVDPGDLVLYDETAQAAVDLSGLGEEDVTYDPVTNTAVWNLSAVPLEDGNYTASLPRSTVRDATGNSLENDGVLHFHRLVGDINGDRYVNIHDAFLFNQSWGAKIGEPAYNAGADFNGNGKIDIFDAFLLNQAWGHLVQEPAGDSSSAAGLSAPVELAPPDSSTAELSAPAESPPASSSTTGLSAPAEPPPAGSSTSALSTPVEPVPAISSTVALIVPVEPAPDSTSTVELSVPADPSAANLPTVVLIASVESPPRGELADTHPQDASTSPTFAPEALAGAGAVGQIPVVVQRVSGTGSDLLVSSAIAFPEGVLFDVKDIIVEKDGVELRVATGEIVKWPDSLSIRSVLLQYQYHLGSADRDTLTLKYGLDRTSADIPLTSITWILPEAITIPDPEWMCSTGVIGSLVPAGTTVTTPHGTVTSADYDRNFADNYRAYEGVSGTVPNVNYYDNAHSLYQQFLRTGNVEYYKLARQWAVYHRTYQVAPVGSSWPGRRAQDGARNSRYTYVEALVDDYFLNGDTTSLDVAGVITDYFYMHFETLTPTVYSPYYIPPRKRGFWTEREPAFALVGIITYYEATLDTQYLDEARRIVHSLHQMQLDNKAIDGQSGFIHNLYDHDPSEGATTSEWGGSPWMTGLLLEGIVKYHIISQDPVAADSIFLALDWLTDYGLNTAGNSFRYLTCAAYPKSGGGTPDLNLLIAPAYAYGYMLSGYTDGQLFTIARDVWNYGISEAFLRDQKHLNQNYRSSAHFLGYLSADLTPPAVTGVRVNGRALDSVSTVEPDLAGIRTIEVTFSEAAHFTDADVLLQTVTFPGGAEKVTGTVTPLSVDGSGTDTMTITLSGGSAVGTWVKVTLRDSIADLAGNLLDGDAPAGGSGRGYLYDASKDLPSGDGSAGGDASFYVGSLIGDCSGDGKVDIFDAFALNQAWGSVLGGAKYNPKADFTGDGKVNIFDAFQLNSHWGNQLDALPIALGDMAGLGTSELALFDPEPAGARAAEPASAAVRETESEPARRTRAASGLLDRSAEPQTLALTDDGLQLLPTEITAG